MFKYCCGIRKENLNSNMKTVPKKPIKKHLKKTVKKLVSDKNVEKHHDKYAENHHKHKLHIQQKHLYDELSPLLGEEGPVGGPGWDHNE